MASATTPVNFTWTTARTPSDVRGWVSSSVVDILRRAGYQVQSDTPDELVMTRPAPFPWPLLFVSVLAFLFGTKRPCQVVFKFLTTSAGLTQVLIIGELPRRVAAALYELPPNNASRG